MTPFPVVAPPALSELELFAETITPRRSTERLWFSVLPVLLVLLLVGLVVYALAW